MSYLRNILKFLFDTNKALKKVQSQLTKMDSYDLETLNTDRAVPYHICISKLSKISCKKKLTSNTTSI